MSTDRVDFTRGAAERIARAVRIVEQGERDQSGPRYGRVLDDPPKQLTLATFTGNWAVNSYKTVTFANVTSTPNTANVLNLCTPVVGFFTSNTTETRYVVYGRVRFTTDPVVVEIQAQPTATCAMTLGSLDLTAVAGYSAADIQMLGHNTTGPCLQWYSITTCGTSTATP